MLFKSTLAIGSLLTFAATSVQAWTLKSSLSGDNFINGFSFFTAADPTHGFVQYKDKSYAVSNGLYTNAGGQIIIKPDTSNVTPNGRPAVRIVSNASYSNGLFIFDLAHMPTGCGTWPAYWMVGPNWPNSGEIDIIENVNTATNNQITLHTKDGCTMAGVSRTQTGSTVTNNCYINAAGQYANQGCAVFAPNSNTYGVGFNNIGGGVYATSLTSSGIKTWFFPRNSIPSDISSNAPNPNNWGAPIADFPFGSNCPSNYFQNLQIVINLTFCGDWAGSVYGSSGCPSSCNDFVANNPGAFNEAYWKINSLKVYQ